jgi:hypothetical protein
VFLVSTGGTLEHAAIDINPDNSDLELDRQEYLFLAAC